MSTRGTSQTSVYSVKRLYLHVTRTARNPCPFNRVFRNLNVDIIGCHSELARSCRYKSRHNMIRELPKELGNSDPAPSAALNVIPSPSSHPQQQLRVLLQGANRLCKSQYSALPLGTVHLSNCLHLQAAQLALLTSASAVPFETSIHSTGFLPPRGSYSAA